MKKVLVTGNGKSGSWHIRGAQLGQAIGADVIPKARAVKGADITVIVKRIDMELIRNARTPIVYDIVDGWPQPIGNTWDRKQCLHWLESQIKLIKPHAIVAATRAMAHDVKVLFGGPVLALPHHARPNQTVNPIAPTMRVVGYEGGVQYLGKWHADMVTECMKRGWSFVTNPACLADLDVVVAVREAQGYAARNWKSGVKLANAQGTGTPFIGCREAGYEETASGAELWADDMREMRAALGKLEDANVRRDASETLYSARPKLEDVAATYRKWLETL